MDDFRETPSPETRAWERGWHAAWAANDLEDRAMRTAAYDHAMKTENPETKRDFTEGWNACMESCAEGRYG
jgi:hypothetical protein